MLGGFRLWVNQNPEEHLNPKNTTANRCLKPTSPAMDSPGVSVKEAALAGQSAMVTAPS